MWCRFLGGGRVSAQPMCDKRLRQPQAEGLNPSAGRGAGRQPSWHSCELASTCLLLHIPLNHSPRKAESASSNPPLCLGCLSLEMGADVQSHCYQSLKWKPVKDTRTFWKILPEYGEQRLSPVSPGKDWQLARNASQPPPGGSPATPGFSGSVNKS